MYLSSLALFAFLYLITPVFSIQKVPTGCNDPKGLCRASFNAAGTDSLVKSLLAMAPGSVKIGSPPATPDSPCGPRVQAPYDGTSPACVYICSEGAKEGATVAYGYLAQVVQKVVSDCSQTHAGQKSAGGRYHDDAQYNVVLTGECAWA